MDRGAVGTLNFAAYGGAGLPVLLVHGMAAHVHWWDDTGPLLAAETKPVAVDLTGHGDSPWREDGVYGAGPFVEDIEAARKLLGWERFALVGHSLGARVACEYAALHPKALSHLVAVDFLTEVPESRARDRAQPHYRTMEEAASRFRLQPTGTALTPEQLLRLGEKSLKPAAGGGFTWKFDWRGFKYPYAPVWPFLEKIACPTLVVRGELSGLMDEAMMSRVASGIRGAKTATVAGAYHHVSLDKPRELAQLLLDFLR